MRFDHADVIILDDPRPDRPPTKRERWLTRKWAFRVRMILRRRVSRATRSNRKSPYLPELSEPLREALEPVFNRAAREFKRQGWIVCKRVMNERGEILLEDEVPS